MDTSSEYMKMCERAEEIQVAKGKLERHDLWIWRGMIGWGEKPISCRYAELPMFFHGLKRVWVPRQDQLQEMVDDGSSAYGQLGRFYNFVNVNPRLQSSDWTWEQLWLIYVMRWQYNKVWDGENWNTQSSTQGS